MESNRLQEVVVYAVQGWIFQSEFDFGSDLVLELSEEPESQLRDAIMSIIEKLEKVIEDNENQKILLYHPIEAADLNSITIPDKTFKKKKY